LLPAQRFGAGWQGVEETALKHNAPPGQARAALFFAPSMGEPFGQKNAGFDRCFRRWPQAGAAYDAGSPSSERTRAH
jgi:hypothetical protein